MLKMTYGNIYAKNTEIVKERILPKDELTVALDFLNSVESEFYDENGNLPEDYYGSDIIITYEEIWDIYERY